MTLSPRKGPVWKSWGRWKLKIDLTEKISPLRGIELIAPLSQHAPLEDRGSNQPNAQITRIADDILLRRVQRLQ